MQLGCGGHPGTRTLYHPIMSREPIPLMLDALYPLLPAYYILNFYLMQLLYLTSSP